MHMYNNGTSLDSKQRNWSLLEIFFKRHRFDIPEIYVEGTIHCKEGAAQLLVKKIYEILTNRSLNEDAPEGVEFSDYAYQAQLPFHARSTATQAVKNNLRITEIMADKNIILGQQKSQNILDQHVEHRKQERELDPTRFARKPTLGELAIRSPPAPTKQGTQMTEQPSKSEEDTNNDRTSANSKRGVSREISQDVPFKEIDVLQLGKTTPQSIPSC